MKFEEVLPAFMRGKKINRICYGPNKAVTKTDYKVTWTISDITAHDWEVVETEEEKLRRERLEWLERVLDSTNNCGIGWKKAVYDIAKEMK